MYKQLREFLGIPQQLMADHLRVTRSHLSMIESHRRGLDVKKLLSLLEINKIMDENNPQEQADERLIYARQSQNSKKQQLIEAHLFIAKYKLNKLKKDLAKLQTAQERSTKIISRVNFIRPGVSYDNGLLLNFIEAQSRVLQEKTSAYKQLPIQIQIFGLQAEVDFLEEELKDTEQ